MAVITISRQFGAGGKTLSQKVAAQLGYSIAHEEIIEQLAEAASVSPAGIHAFEAEGEGVIDQSTGMLMPKRFLDHIFDPSRKYMDGKRYVKLLEKIIPSLANRGNIIFIGRGAQFLLKDREDTFHVLMVAEERDRIAFMEKNYNLSRSDAEVAIKKQGKRRTKLMKLFHTEDYDQPYYYTLVLNMSKIDMDHAVRLVCKLVVPS